ncbi:Uncharacterised protein [Mycobacterium tuberculosis]|nr:Uncharacterised protein [Mycobacterium tuberculosis]
MDVRRDRRRGGGGLAGLLRFEERLRVQVAGARQAGVDGELPFGMRPLAGQLRQRRLPVVDGLALQRAVHRLRRGERQDERAVPELGRGELVPGGPGLARRGQVQGRAREDLQIAVLVAAFPRVGERGLQGGAGLPRGPCGVHRGAALVLRDGQRDAEAGQRQRPAARARLARLVDEFERRLDAVHVAERADHLPGEHRARLQVLGGRAPAAVAPGEPVPPVLALLLVRRLPAERPEPPLLPRRQRARQERAADGLRVEHALRPHRLDVGQPAGALHDEERRDRQP